MFKCVDCGQEFETKPEYCDCGNNFFEEIIELPKSQATEKEKVVIFKQLKPQIKEEKTEIHKTTTQKSLKKEDIFSILFFIACLILSVLSVIYIGKDSLAKMEKNKNNIQTEQKTVQTTGMPSIDKLWIDSKPQQYTPNKQESKIQAQPISKPVEPKPIAVIKPPKTQNTTTKNVINIPQTPKVTQPKQTKTVQPKTQTKNVTPNTSSKPVSKQQTVTNPQTTQQVKITTQNNTVNSAQELSQYKVDLRNALAGKINFTNVVGDGNCTVTFKLDHAGNLLNRKFAVQSDNDSLNDAVFVAIKSMPTYQSPPAAYKGETFSFSVKMYSGRFSVTLY